MRAMGVCAVLFVLLPGCTAIEDPGLPPLTAEPSYPLFSDDDPVQDDLPARTVLQKFLRGAGNGNAKVCEWLRPEADRFPAGCPQWVAKLPAVDRARLKQVKVPTAAEGEGQDEWIVEAAEIVWPAGAPRSIAAARFVLRLRLTDGRWMIAATE